MLWVFYFCSQLLSGVGEPICGIFCTNVSSFVRLKQTRRILKEFKNQVTTAKEHHKIVHFLSHCYLC